MKQQERMDTMHWSEEQLLNRLYGLDADSPAQALHLEQCASCGERWRRLTEARQAMLAVPPEVSSDRLRAQREQIWRRVESSCSGWIWRVVPATATAMVLMVALVLQQAPAPSPAPVEVSQSLPSDGQFFEEIASVANADVPRAADPIRSLFDTQFEGEAQ